MKNKNVKIDKKKFNLSKIVILLMLFVIIASYIVQLMYGM